ncbi:MAG: hypothetical protein F6K11_07320 [Leptolyngbya sp. SIO3F4]|nr:hypothetical protein [Leptolyngbya sp. SIO3F4]
MKVKKVSPLYAETRVLLNLNAYGEDEVSPSNFVPTGNVLYKQALTRLTEEGCLSEIPNGKRYKKYSLTSQGRQRLIKNLSNEEFAFFSNLGPKTTNGLLKVFRESISVGISVANGSTNIAQNGNGHFIGSYDDFSKFVIDFCQKIDAEDDLGGLVPIYRVRRELGDAVARAQFDKWLFDLQAEERLQMMSDDLSRTPQDQKDDSVRIPGDNLRFYINLL